MIWAFILCSLFVEFCGISVTLTGATRSYKGPMGKSDRAVVLAVVATILAYAQTNSLNLFPALNMIFLIASILMTITAVNRLRTIRSLVQK